MRVQLCADELPMPAVEKIAKNKAAKYFCGARYLQKSQPYFSLKQNRLLEFHLEEPVF